MSGFLSTTPPHPLKNYLTTVYGIYYLVAIDNIIATGLTNQEFAFYEEKVGIKQNGDKIELYVNNYGLGGSVYGVGEASKYYFGKSVSELTLPEASFSF